MRFPIGRGFGRGLGGLHMAGLGGHRYYRPVTAGSIIVTFVGMIAFVVLNLRAQESEEPARPPPLHQVAPVIEPGLPVFHILQRAGAPTCKAAVADGERWVYGRREAPREPCEPERGDLVVVVRGEEVLRFTPEHGISMEVAGPGELQAFRARYAGGR